MTIDATLTMLRARREERVAIVGVLCAVMGDDLPDLPRRLECVRDSARECNRATDRKDRRMKDLTRQIEDMAADLLGPAQQMVDRDPLGTC